MRTVLDKTFGADSSVQIGIQRTKIHAFPMIPTCLRFARSSIACMKTRPDPISRASERTRLSGSLARPWMSCGPFRDKIPRLLRNLSRARLLLRSTAGKEPRLRCPAMKLHQRGHHHHEEESHSSDYCLAGPLVLPCNTSSIVRRGATSVTLILFPFVIYANFAVECFCCFCSGEREKSPGSIYQPVHTVFFFLSSTDFYHVVSYT